MINMFRRLQMAVPPGLCAGHRAVVALVFALFAGIGTRSQWNNWVLLVNASKFPTADQQFHKNIGFYVFQLPFINFVLSWLFVALIITLVMG